MQKLLEQIAMTAELMGSEISPTAAAMMCSDLSGYPKELVIEALSHVRKEYKSRLSLALIIEKIDELTPGGRPSPEEAWAMVPKDESASAVITEEMAMALKTAQPLIDDGDLIAARMAFKDTYTNLVRFNKTHGFGVKWFPSLGDDKSGREPVLAEAVRNKRLDVEHALRLVAPEKTEEFMQLAGVKNLAIENKTSNSEKMKRMKEMIEKSELLQKP